MSASMHVASLMNLITMVMHEACADGEAAAENRHLRTWFAVSSSISFYNCPDTFHDYFLRLPLYASIHYSLCNKAPIFV